jgi:hypothetical protein
MPKQPESPLQQNPAAHPPPRALREKYSPLQKCTDETDETGFVSFVSLFWELTTEKDAAV